MDSVFTEAFYSSYKGLSDDEATLVDGGIRRLLVDHATGWARQGRIEGEKGSAWIVTLISQNSDASLYWDYDDDETVILLALVVRR